MTKKDFEELGYKRIRKDSILMKGYYCKSRYDGILNWLIEQDSESGDIGMYTGFACDYSDLDFEYTYISSDFYYGRIAKSLEDFRKLTINEIEGKAYNIYMTFAR